MAHNDDFHDDMAALALGTLNAAQADFVRSHSVSCEECRNEYRALRAAADAVGVSAEIPRDRMNADQSARMKSRIFASLRSHADANPHFFPSPKAARARSAWLAYALAAAAFLVALLSTVRNVTLDAELRTAREHLAQLREQINDKARATAEQNARIADLFAADGKHYAVPGGEIVKRGDHLYLAMRWLPKLPAGRVFQAWTRTSGATGMTPSATFTPNRQGMAIVQLPVSASTVSAVAISIEPEGGSKAPTTTPTFLEKL